MLPNSMGYRIGYSPLINAIDFGNLIALHQEKAFRFRWALLIMILVIFPVDAQ